ncbi:MBL fold metallo-hydrolase [Phenylobacterium ferrooxidans]|uniref:MBL fold metallo-hydrolase n=1 Tax=Phenylobacterium ferrooxidans TaxID=2982689 RepID=A0ABW6CQC0_9CAUL
MSSLPEIDEIEVSVLGKNFGESIVIHVGDSKWVVVDSLLDDSGVSAPLRYLQERGVDVAADLQLCVVTHWHGDHIGGMSSLLEAAPNAEVALPAVFGQDNFKSYLESCLKSKNTTDEPLREIARIGELLAPGKRPAPIYAQGTTPLLTLGPGRTSHGLSVTLTGLSPSNRDMHYFYLRLSPAPPGPGAAKPMAHRENDASIAAWLTIGEDAVLLGADLETVLAPDRGWNAILSSPHRPPGKASIYKVAHHGSVTGHHEGIWVDLLLPENIAAIAPWNRNTGLPKSADQMRILDLSPQAFVTAQVSSRKFKSTPSIDKTLSDFGILVADTNHRVGTIRFRKKISAPPGDWEVELSDGAIPLRDFVARS